MLCQDCGVEILKYSKTEPKKFEKFDLHLTGDEIEDAMLFCICYKIFFSKRRLEWTIVCKNVAHNDWTS